MSELCKRCKGSGEIVRIDSHRNEEIIECPDCNGTGNSISGFVKVFSTTGKLIATFDKVKKSETCSDNRIQLKLDNGKSVTLVGGIIIVVEDK